MKTETDDDIQFNRLVVGSWTSHRLAGFVQRLLVLVARRGADTIISCDHVRQIYRVTKSAETKPRISVV